MIAKLFYKTSAPTTALRHPRHPVMTTAVGAMLALLLAIAIVAVLIGTADAQPFGSGRPNPFGTGGPPVRDEAAPGLLSGFFAWLVAQQALFYKSMTALVRDAREDGSAFVSLVGVAFAYGIFHAAGPGHGKAVIGAYVAASARAMRTGVVVSFLAAGIQALAALVLVGFIASVVGLSAQRLDTATRGIELASYAFLAAFGAVLLVRKARLLLAAVRARAAERAFERMAFSAGGGFGTGLGTGLGAMVADGAPLPKSPVGAPRLSAACALPDCGHDHGFLVETSGESRRALWSTAFAAGLRPCSGAIIVLVFAIAQGLWIAGVAAVLAMALGTALVTSLVALFTLLAKRGAARLAASPGEPSLFGPMLEAVAALAVLALGLGLLFGLIAGGS